MEKVILNDHSKSSLLIYIGIFFLVLISVPIFGMVSYGVSVVSVILLVLILGLIAMTILYLKNHKAFLEIDANGITYYETKGLTKSVKVNWTYKFADCVQIVIIPVKRSIGRASNIQDCMDVVIVESLVKNKTFSLNMWLDTTSRMQIEKLKIENSINNLTLK